MTTTSDRGGMATDASTTRRPLHRPPGGMLAGSLTVAVLLTAASLAGLVGGAALYDASPRPCCRPGVMPRTCW